MRELAEATDESVALFSLDEQTSVCLAKEFGSSRRVFSIKIFSTHTKNFRFISHFCQGFFAAGQVRNSAVK
jgi:hypothetical protein